MQNQSPATALKRKHHNLLLAHAGTQTAIPIKGTFRFRAFGPTPPNRAKYLALLSQMLTSEHDAKPQYVPRLAANIELPVKNSLLRERMIELIEPLWVDTIKNGLTTQGKNYLLDKFLAGASYTAAWYIGLISSASYTALTAGDTYAQINGTNGWKEAATANAPNYSQSARVAPAWDDSIAGVKATSADVVYTISTPGTAKGAFLASVATKDNATSGANNVLFSTGLFVQGDRAVLAGDTITAGYSLTLT